MPAERVSMRQIREVLRLRFASELSQRAIAKSLGLSQAAVSGYLSRARAAGVSWPLAEDLDDGRLEALLFPPPSAMAADQRPLGPRVCGLAAGGKWIRTVGPIPMRARTLSWR